MQYYYAESKRGNYFEGWYLKHQGEEGEFAVIPAIHQWRGGTRTASIQVVTREGSQLFSFPSQDFDAQVELFQVRIGGNWFSRDGIHLDLQKDAFSIKGDLRYGAFTPPQGDIMGPFRFLPAMQCVHGIYSMRHPVDGMLQVNGQSQCYSNGVGYSETDRGRSFPRVYLWTQCSWSGRQQGSIMLAIAHIPLPVGGFTGCICEILFAGRHHRIASYQGAKVEWWGERGCCVVQKGLRLVIEQMQGAPQPLAAPDAGRMTRTIHESLCATVHYRLWEGETLVFDHVDTAASFEYGAPTQRGRKSKTRKKE